MQTTAARNAITKFAMPAMSPTMTEGGIASWKKKEGDTFEAGDVLLEIETDKATIDVEAQDDGVLGKIIAQDGEKGIPVGKTIALLAEEGDDIANLEVPAEESASSTPQPPSKPSPSPPASTPSPPPSKESAPAPPSEFHVPKTSRPLFPSVLRLIQEHHISGDAVEKITGTGVRGMLTKGDVLTHLGLASSPTGTYRETPAPDVKTDKKVEKKEDAAPLDGASIRRLIVGSMLDASTKARAAAVPKVEADFDSVIADYLPPSKPKPVTPVPALTSTPKSVSFIDGLI
ncbi:single hybrid motif-containing protein [Trametes versicolor FP-101664 SS1]|uniref:single hybrid motif-containing protein n=1 Tax=Trametes versicolor (strain FP-101664) TaxID=717944 RepID=UPI00046217A3|nr:single hybrid motif-containing protein [Trametes versicolor FP-101664 SS1]EIW60860.1 single hybrid motif-containing protein [Trametes versicolor FP-101664 SS1]